MALARVLDAMDVEGHWKAGEHISDWRTGETDGTKGGPPTHCSLFVAAACRKLGVPMPGPPPQAFLSNRQHQWLLKEGRDEGWRRVRDPVEAQRLANRGVVVAASYESPDAKRPGHIAVVRPAAVEVGRVRERGPRIAQAGATNYRDTDVATGFRHHRGAWERGEVLFFAYRPGGG
jgi:hypothetical protein